MQATKLRVNFLFALLVAFLAIYSSSAFAVARSATVYYSLATKGWVTARIHHNAGGTWTAVPGIAMTSACAGWMVATISFDDASSPTFQAVFNNGSGTWDNPNGGGNYVVGAGTSVVSSGSALANAGNPCAAPSPDGTAIVYYRLLNGWTSANIHYQIGSGPWTAVPGLPMNEAACPGWVKRTIALGTASGLKAAFNTNGTTWDNNSNQDYVLGAGLSTINNRTLTSNANNPCGGGADTTPPSVPQNVTAIAGANGTSITVNWSASVDNAGGTGVASYSVTRTGGAQGTVTTSSTSNSFTSTDLTSNTSYAYTVRAIDRAGNQSAPSMVASATTGGAQAGTPIRIYFKAATPVAIWMWENPAPPGRAISQLSGHAFPGPNMTADPANPGWVYWDIPTRFYPLNGQLAFLFGGSQNQINLAGPVTTSMWWNGSSWSPDNPDPIMAPSIKVTPDGGFFGSVTAVSVTITAATRAAAPITAMTYRLNNDAAVSVTTNPATIGVPLSSLPTTLTVTATNRAGTSTFTSKTYNRGTQPLPAFHWGNATVYFVMTDRFVNGNAANDSSHNRPRVDATGLNIGTFHGGDLAGLTTKIHDNYFTDLGVNALWITAPYEQIHGWIGGGDRGDFAHWGYHGYYTLDWTNLDANLGTPNELKSFVDAAHAKGIRVVFDVVMNHAGYDTMQDMVEFNYGGKRPNFTEAAVLNWRPGEGQTWHSYHDIFIDYASPAAQPGWANWWGQPWLRAGIVGYDGCGGGDLVMCLAGLPDLKTENPTAVALPPFLRNKPTFGKGYLTPYTANGSKPVREWVSEWLCKYVRDYGIDGFRVDTAKHVETPAWGFMKDRCSAALAQWRATNPDAPGANWTDDFWTTGEVFGRGAAGFDANYYVTGKFDSLINFGFRGVAAGAAGTADALANLDGTYASYASQLNADRTYSFSLLSFLDNHDIAPLFFNGDAERQKRAGTALLMTPGAVQVFYGDEYGRTFGATGSDPTQGTRSDMNWGAVTSQLANPASTLSHWQKIGQFRRKHVAVGIGDHQRISDVSNGYAFTRVWNEDKVAVVVGASGNTTVNVTAVFANGTQVRNYYDSTTRTVSDGRVTFAAGANGVILLELAN